MKRVVSLTMLIMALVAMSASFIMAAPSKQSGVTITVDTTEPGIADDGNCSLIEAIVNANEDKATHQDCDTGSGADTIQLETDATYTLKEVNNQGINGNNGLPVITGKLTIEGDGATIQRSAASGTPAFRFFQVITNSALTLEDVTLQNGSAYRGGAIYNLGSVVLTTSAVLSNTADRTGGGIDGKNGFLTLSESTVSYNKVISGWIRLRTAPPSKLRRSAIGRWWCQIR